MGVSPAAADWGVPEQAVIKMAETIYEDRGRFRNQIGEPKRADIDAFLRESLRGD